MTERRFIVGSLTRPAYYLIATKQGPVPAYEGRFRFPSQPNGHGRLHEQTYSYSQRDNALKLPPGWVAVETDDPALVAEIDAADEAVRKAEEALLETKRARREVLAGVAARCKPARVR